MDEKWKPFDPPDATVEEMRKYLQTTRQKSPKDRDIFEHLIIQQVAGALTEIEDISDVLSSADEETLPEERYLKMAKALFDEGYRVKEDL